MKRSNIIIILSIISIAFLFSACSSSAPVTPITTQTQQEQTPAQVTPTPAETTPPAPVTSTPSESTAPSTPVSLPEPMPVVSAPAVTGVSATELALHNSKSDCWVVYKNTTYDVTKYLPKHPGGTLAISKHCGTLDFEKAFKGQHGTSKEKGLTSNSVNMGAYVG